MKSNWMTLVPYLQQIWLNVGSQQVWLHSKDTIVPGMEPTNEGWNGSKYAFRLTDQEAQALLLEWLSNGPFVMETNDAGAESLERMPTTVEQRIRSIENTSVFRQFQNFRKDAA